MPVVGLPGIFQPRAAVAYMVVIAAEVASLAGIAPRLHTEIDAAAAFLTDQAETLQQQAREIATLVAGAVPVIYGSDLTAPVARRWKTQVNENAKFPAFWGELPEADHNELCGWAGAAGDERAAAIFLEDRDQHPRIARRFELTAKSVKSGAAAVARVETAGETRLERMLWAVMLGDLVTLELARQRGVDPLPVDDDRPLQGGDGMRAMVLAAGLGTRLRPITFDRPKPMVPVLNRPVMEHILRLLARHGFDRDDRQPALVPGADHRALRRRLGLRRLAELQPGGGAARHLGWGPQRGRLPHHREEAGGADRRPHQRRAARLRQPDRRAGGAHQPGRHRARASSSRSRARTSASAWRSCWSRRASPRWSPRR